MKNSDRNLKGIPPSTKQLAYVKRLTRDTGHYVPKSKLNKMEMFTMSPLIDKMVNMRRGRLRWLNRRLGGLISHGALLVVAGALKLLWKLVSWLAPLLGRNIKRGVVAGKGKIEEKYQERRRSSEE